MAERDGGSGTRFEEVQRLAGSAAGWTVLGIVAAAAAVVGAAFVARPPREPGEWVGAVLGAGGAALAAAVVLAARQVTRVSDAGVVVSLSPVPFTTIRIRADDIARASLYEYGLLSAPGGIGWHMGPGWRAVTTTTGTGVLITRRNGGRVLIGTDRPDTLLSAIRNVGAPAPV